MVVVKSKPCRCLYICASTDETQSFELTKEELAQVAGAGTSGGGTGFSTGSGGTGFRYFADGVNGW